MYAILCPGQGSQTPGFLKPWLENADARELVTDVSAKINLDLALHGTESDAETIKQTKIAQPLIVVAGILALQKLRSLVSDEVYNGLTFAGHSVGEITAAFGAGIFTAGTAMRFVNDRANAMQECALDAESGMIAVLGADSETIDKVLREYGLAPANYNGAGQVVAAGALDAIAKFQEAAPAGLRLIPLQVAGAFHTDFMAEARDQMRKVAPVYEASDPKAAILTNFNGTVISDGEEYKSLLVEQIASPVRWDKCMERLQKLEITQLLEMPPAGALAGLARRGMPGTTALKINTPDGVAEAARVLTEATAA